jgi:hypothetical protein
MLAHLAPDVLNVACLWAALISLRVLRRA